jgi:hypothetical protein
MTKRTIDLIIKIAIEVADWLTTILNEKRKRRKDDGEGNSKEKCKS